MWDATTGVRTALLEGHAGDVRRVVLTAGARFAVTASDDCTARVWDLAAEPITLPAVHHGSVTAVQVRAALRPPVGRATGRTWLLGAWPVGG